jgi:hypothetical protein
MQIKEAEEKLSSGFFGFWLKQRRVTILVLIVIILIGGYSAIRIPKESVPEITTSSAVDTVCPFAISFISFLDRNQRCIKGGNIKKRVPARTSGHIKQKEFTVHHHHTV